MIKVILFAAFVLLVLGFILLAPQPNKRANDVSRSNAKRRHKEGW